MKKTHKLTKEEADLIRRVACNNVGRGRVKLEVNLREDNHGNAGYNILSMVGDHDMTDTAPWGRFRSRVFPLVDGAAMLDVAIQSSHEDGDGPELLSHVKPVWEAGVLVRIEGYDRVLWQRAA
ncbi:hypothetical protein HOU02_gp212 [Caulobacter phage CcrBL9]|uniref:Uncharacterized protein n=1 Tax=Caulobacter phage CcrBL9 TaxID=2283270 RepID=A0A385ECK9_9CAUD|nr:hypothetical protein HOU02_gp212 [Caulobacter phage CcrBL9]AXQ69513.1 hypothetical protein CcrBL9_gp489 [Caulobacter phage CcrBL9]